MAGKRAGITAHRGKSRDYVRSAGTHPEDFLFKSEPSEMAPLETLEDMEREMIRKALERHEGNLSAVAFRLGITRQTLYNKMKKFNL